MDAFFRSWLEGREEHIPAGAIKVRLPHVRQQQEYSCGAAALRAVATYFGADLGSEEEYIRRLGTDEEDGTRPQEIVRGARHLGLRAMTRDWMTVRELRSLLDKGIPIVVPVQAYGEKGTYWVDNSSGHYVVVVGYGKGRLYFVDPMMDGGYHAFLSEHEFMTRWHDFDADGHRCHRLGIVIWSGRGRRPDWAERGAQKMP